MTFRGPPQASGSLGEVSEELAASSVRALYACDGILRVFGYFARFLGLGEGFVRGGGGVVCSCLFLLWILSMTSCRSSWVGV